MVVPWQSAQVWLCWLPKGGGIEKRLMSAMAWWVQACSCAEVHEHSMWKGHSPEGGWYWRTVGQPFHIHGSPGILESTRWSCSIASSSSSCGMEVFGTGRSSPLSSLAARILSGWFKAKSMWRAHSSLEPSWRLMGTCPGGTALVETRDWIDPERCGGCRERSEEKAVRGLLDDLW